MDTGTPSTAKVKTPPGLVWQRGKGLTLAVVGLDFGSPPFLFKRIPPFGHERQTLFISSSEHMRTASKCPLLPFITRLDAHNELDGESESESEPESEGESHGESDDAEELD